MGNLLPNDQVGDNGMSYDESVDQENYMMYTSYLSMVENGGCTQEEAMELLQLTEEQINAFIEQFELTEEEENEE